MHCLLALSLALPLAANAATHTMIQNLDDPRFEVRQHADETLRLAGLHVVPRLQTALKADPPLEVSRRLQAIIDHYTRPDWHAWLNEGVAEAKRTGKPLLVVAAPTAPAIADMRLAHFLKQHYVVVWQVDANPTNVHLFSNVTPNGGVRRFTMACYLCSADSTVKQAMTTMPRLEELMNPDGSARTLLASAPAVPDPGAVQQDNVRIIDGQQINAKNPQIKFTGRYRYSQSINPIGRPITEVFGVVPF